MLPSSVREAAVEGAKLYLVMAAGSALFIVVAYALTRAAPALTPSPSDLGQLPSTGYSTYQVSVHVVTGFAAGAVSLDPVMALVGAGMGPLVDLDHLGFFAGLPVEARVAHSVFFIAFLLLVEWRTRFWRRGTRNFALFTALQYSVHFAAAPPGFPLLAPFSVAIFEFPSWEPAALAAVFAVAFFIDSRRYRSPTSD